MSVFKIIQGDSFARDYSSDYFPVLDSHWEGSWAIVDKLGPENTRAAAGDLILATDGSALELRISPSDTESIPTGMYFLVVEIRNDALEYKREVDQVRCLIKEQGI